MVQAFIGVYWTLPVNWAGFRDLPDNVDAAASASRTIRYQRARVWEHLRAVGDILAGEIAFMDTRTDRATDAVRDVLQRAAPKFGRVAGLVAVQFAEVHQWRRNPYVDGAAADLGLSVLPLPPTPMVIDGKRFDPIRHFKAWRAQDKVAMARLRIDAHEALSAALAAIPVGEGRWRRVADRLNSQGSRTIQGGAWTAESVRKFTQRDSDSVTNP